MASTVLRGDRAHHRKGLKPSCSRAEEGVGKGDRVLIEGCLRRLAVRGAVAMARAGWPWSGRAVQVGDVSVR